MALPAPPPPSWAHLIGELLSREVPELDAFEELARGLVALHKAMLEAPDDVLTAFDTLTERELSDWELTWDRRLVNGSLVYDIPFDEPRACALQVGGLIRAWDHLLLTLQSHLGPVADSDEWLFGEHYVIPRKYECVWSPAAINQGYRVRGLLHHRIVPALVGELQLVVTPLATVEDDPHRIRKRFGAAVFKDFDLTVEKRNGKFRATGLNDESHLSEIQKQLEASSEDDCFAIVWPELTMPNSHREEVVRVLRSNPEMRIFPELVVTGSWHQEDRSGNYNASLIISRYGKPIAKCDKSVPYSDNELGTEDITTGKTLALIVTDTTLVTFGICKDFCTINRKVNVYHALKADVVIVPSMGTLSTINEHRTAANNLRNAVGGRAFIVQQHLPRNGGPGAFVLPLDRKKDDPAIPLENGTTWASFD